MLDILTTIKIGIISVALGAASLFGWVPETQAPAISQSTDSVLVGGTFQTPSTVGLFTTSLAAKITSSDTSMTLVSSLDKEGVALASSTYGFIIDEGTSVEEFVLADCTGTACTNMTRGVSVTTATSSVSSLKFEHRRGASVKITTHPAVVFAINVLKGKQNIEMPLKYSSSVSTTTLAADRNSIASAGLVADTAFASAGVIDATTAAKGVSELATQIETASSTSQGSSGVLVIPASYATSTFNSVTAPLRVVVTRNDGRIDGGFVASSTGFSVAGNLQVSATSTLATTTINSFIPQGLMSTTTLINGTSMTLSNLPATDMFRILVNASSTNGASTGVVVTFNGDGGSNYSFAGVNWGEAATSYTTSLSPLPLWTGTNGQVLITMDILSQTSAVKYINMQAVATASNGGGTLIPFATSTSAIYKGTGRITSVTVTFSQAGSLVAGSSIKAIVPTYY